MPTSGSGAASGVVAPPPAGGHLDFAFARVSPAAVPADSVEYFEVSVSALDGDTAATDGQLAAASVEVAFAASAGAERTYLAMERPSAGRARLLLGPGGAQLARGAYFVFLRAASAPETEVKALRGVLRVF